MDGEVIAETRRRLRRPSARSLIGRFGLNARKH